MRLENYEKLRKIIDLLKNKIKLDDISSYEGSDYFKIELTFYEIKKEVTK